MKNQTSLTLAMLALAGLLGSPSPASAASFTEAQFTRLENDVKVLKESASPHAAAVGENVKAVTSVATGLDSRAELKFPDNSLTRLGANSRFTIRGDERTLDLDKGVMLLQVPKKMGGAKVRTAAVTAAVTGTTAVYEYLPNGYIKLIVIEGTVDLYSNKNPSHFQEVHAGQMIIMDPNSTNIPPPVDIDLKRLLRTSKLLAGYDQMPNASYIASALQQQQSELKSGTLLDTNLVIPGLGTYVSFSNNDAFSLNGGLTVQNNPTPKPPQPPAKPGNPNNGGGSTPPPPPAFTGFVPVIAGTTVLNANSNIVTDPTVTAFNSNTGGLLTSQGLVYRGQALDGAMPFFVFGSGVPADSDFQAMLNTTTNGWSTFKFESLLINGAPNFTIDKVSDVLLTAVGDITLSPDNTSFPGAGGGTSEGSAFWNLSFYSSESPQLTGLALYSQNGNINMSRFILNGSSTDVGFNALHGSVNVTDSEISLGGGSAVLAAGQDVNVQDGEVNAANVKINAGRNINVSGESSLTATSGNLVLRAINGIHISNSSELRQLASEGASGILRIESKKGPVVIESSTLNASQVGVQAFGKGGTPIQSVGGGGIVAGGNILVSGDNVNAGSGVKMRTMAPGSTLTVGQSSIAAGTGIRLYAGSQTGTLVFTQNTTLDGKFIALAGKTIQVAQGVTVTIVNGGVRIFTDNALFNTAGYGTITRGEGGIGETSAFANRPSFRAPPPLKEGAGSIPRPPKPLRPPPPNFPPRPVTAK